MEEGFVPSYQNEEERLKIRKDKEEDGQIHRIKTE